VQFRAETFNTFTTPLFADPNTAYGSANFGAIKAQASFPRYLQLGLHIKYYCSLPTLPSRPIQCRGGTVPLSYATKGPGNAVEVHAPLAH
jgi:hypothetical protein